MCVVCSSERSPGRSLGLRCIRAGPRDPSSAQTPARERLRLKKRTVPPRFARAFTKAPRAAVAQLVRAPDCGSGGRWFESTQLYQKNHLISHACLAARRAGANRSTPRRRWSRPCRRSASLRGSPLHPSGGRVKSGRIKRSACRTLLPRRPRHGFRVTLPRNPTPKLHSRPSSALCLVPQSTARTDHGYLPA
jgi:hypothetical protein